MIFLNCCRFLVWLRFPFFYWAKMSCGIESFSLVLFVTPHSGCVILICLLFRCCYCTFLLSNENNLEVANLRSWDLFLISYHFARFFFFIGVCFFLFYSLFSLASFVCCYVSESISIQLHLVSHLLFDSFIYFDLFTFFVFFYATFLKFIFEKEKFVISFWFILINFETLQHW